MNAALDGGLDGGLDVERDRLAPDGSAAAPVTSGAPQVDGGEVEPPEVVVAPRHRIVGWATDLETPTTLLLLRHGETAGSVGKVFSGRGGTDHGLTERGAGQAGLAAAVVRARGDVTAIVTSPLLRCRETAARVAELTGLEPTIDDDLAEAAFGEWDGLTFADVEERWPAELTAWLGRTDVAPPGGETIDQVVRRVRRARDRIVAAHPGEVVLVVAHVNPIKSLVRLALDAPAHAIYRMAMTPASFSELEYYPDGMSVLRSFGVSAHLAGATSAAGG